MPKPSSLSGSARSAPPDPMLSAREAAEYLGIALRTLYDWRRTNRVKIVWHRIGPQKVGYRKSDLDAFLAASRHQS